MRDYAKLKALAQQMIECIGDECEGENPSLPANSKMADENGAGQGDNTKMGALSKMPKEKGRGKRSDDVVALMSSALSSKFKK